MIMDHLVKNKNQTIWRALYNDYMISIADSDQNVDKLTTHFQEKAKVLTPSGDFQSWVVQKQTSWDKGNDFDLINFLKNQHQNQNKPIA